MAITVFSGCVQGISGMIISIEVQIFNQLNKFVIVGLADTAIQEAKERAQFAISNSGYHFTKRGIAINLAPAQIRKEGSQLDLAIAVGILVASSQIAFDTLSHTLFLGELGLEGAVRAVPGVIAILLHAISLGFTTAYVPAGNTFEASLIADQITIFSLHNLHDLDTADRISKAPSLHPPTHESTIADGVDFAEIVGNVHAKRALIIAAAGGHNVLLTGPPGTGKSLLAKAFAQVLPALNTTELLTIATIQSISGELVNIPSVNLHRPFRAPHHSASANSIIGGGIVPRPGAITLAHLGVLFLDEFPEFHSDVLENLREPLEEGHITISRTRGSATFPASFQLIAAMNPCPCGFSGDKEIACTCSRYAKERYLKKLSGPILDRIDLFSFVPRMKKQELWHGQAEIASVSWREQIHSAYSAQLCRQDITNAKLKITLANAAEKLCIPVESMDIVKNIEQLSPRGIVRLLKVSRTIADLAGDREVSPTHISEAMNFRNMLLNN